MDEAILEKIKSFSWYQTIEFEPGVKSRGSSFCGDPAWKNIRSFLPPTLEGKRVLDLGCNAGIFCIHSALLGASCVGIEDDSWKNDSNFFAQAEFVLEYFQKKHGLEFDIKYHNANMEEIIHSSDLGTFDYCYGIASLYYAKDQEALVNRIYQIAENVITRIRDDAKIKQLTSYFEKAGYKMRKMLREEMWKVVGAPTDDFYLIHYAR